MVAESVFACPDSKCVWNTARGSSQGFAHKRPVFLCAELECDACWPEKGICPLKNTPRTLKNSRKISCWSREMLGNPQWIGTV